MTRGVKAITLRDGDYVVGMSVVSDDAEFLVVTENGYGKKTPFDEYKVQNRGGVGIRTYKISEQTGCVAGLKSVTENDDVMLMTSDGVIIRLSTKEINSIGRSTKGVRLMRLADGVKVIDIARTQAEDEEENENGRRTARR